VSFRIKKAQVFLLSIFLFQNAFASIFSGLDRPTDQADHDGSHAIGADISTDNQPSFEIHRDFQSIVSANESGIPGALSFLDANIFPSKAYHSFRVIIIAVVGAGVTALTAEILGH
jgi:hypothetical protein